MCACRLRQRRNAMPVAVLRGSAHGGGGARSLRVTWSTRRQRGTGRPSGGSHEGARDVQKRMERLTRMVADPSVPEGSASHGDPDERRRAATRLSRWASCAACAGRQARRAIARMNAECRPLLVALNSAARDYRDFTVARSAALVTRCCRRLRLSTQPADRCLPAGLAAAGIAGVLIVRSLTCARSAPNRTGSATSPDARCRGRSRTGGRRLERCHGQRCASLGDMQRSLAAIVTRVRSSSDSIATGTAQIASGNADLSQRTEEQASNLQQTAASMEQLSGTVKTSAETAREANRLAADAASAAEQGGQMVGQVVSTMRDISSSSQRISDIIGVIDGIAFQTNIRRSTPRWKPREPASRGAASRWWPARCARLPSAAPRPPGDQGAHRHQCREGRGRRQAGRRGGHVDERDRRPGPAREPHDQRTGQRIDRAIAWGHPGRRCGAAAGSGDQQNAAWWRKPPPRPRVCATRRRTWPRP